MNRALLYSLTILGILIVTVSKAPAAVRCDGVMAPTMLRGARLSKVPALNADQGSWGYRAFGHNLEPVEKFFATPQTGTRDEIANAFSRAGLRLPFFRLQSLGMVFKGMDKEFFEPLRVEFKLFEDRLGQLDLARDLLKDAKARGDADKIQEFQAQEAEALANLGEALEQSGWLKDPQVKLKSLRDRIESYKGWPTDSEIRKYIVTTIADDASKLQQDSEDFKFDKKDLEKGLHELRRRLRWLTLEVQGFEGFAEMQPELLTKPVDGYFQELLAENPKILESKYAGVNTKPVVSDPVRVPKLTTAIVAELVERIGTIKDEIEHKIHMKEDPKIWEKYGKEQSEKFMTKINDIHLLREFAKQLKELNP